MTEKHYIVVGNGPAGREAAKTLRAKDGDCRITVISRENRGFYQPNMLPGLISGRFKMEDLDVTPFSFYEEQRLKLRLGQKVVGLDPVQRKIFLDHKEVIPFTGLILAVGGKPRIPEPLLLFEDMMLTLKTVADARIWMERLADAETVLIVGGDLTSLSLVKALLTQGKKIRFVFSDEAFWPVRVNPGIYQAVKDKLTAGGVQVIDGCLRSIVQKSDHKYEAMVDQTRYEADLVGAFFGLRPDVRFLAGSGLQIERGILVDEHLNAGFEGIYAAGDCAQVYHTELRDYWVSIGYDNAVGLGRLAAFNLAGGSEEATLPPESVLCDEGVRVNTSWWMEF